MVETSDNLEVELPERPEPEADPPPEDDWLYASERSYEEQIQYYRAARGVTHAKQVETRTLTCPACGRTFEAYRKDTIACSKNCGKKYYRMKRKAEQREEGAA